MNRTMALMINMKPKDAIKLNAVKNVHSEQNILPEDSLNRYLYQPGEQLGDQKT